MKHLTISELLLLSQIEKKARRIHFDKKKTIILGSNQTGKSSLMKSIYYAMGAEPAKQHPRWVNAEVTTLLKFSVDEQSFIILRQYNSFSIFTGTGRFLQSFSNITEGLGPYLASIFDFKLVLAARDQSAQIPPPAFLFVPYYLDQDASWQNSWSGFSRLQQYTQWKTPVAEYHTGIRDNYYYELQAKYLELSRELNSAVLEISGLRNVLKNLEEDSKNAIFDLSPAAFGDQVDRLLRESEILLVQENDLKEQLADLNGQRALHRSRLDIATRALGEISNDFDFLSGLPTEEIGCPTCGNEYNNDFVARFAIATDEDRVASFIAQIRSEVGRLDTRIADLYAKYRLSQEQATKIQQILAEKQGEVTLGLVIESEGRKAAGNLLRSQLLSAEEKRHGIAVDHDGSADKLKAHRQKLAATERKVLDEYHGMLERNLSELEVLPLSKDAYSELAPPIREIGSMLPRTLLAYSFAILQLASINSPSTVCPVVVDSPNQQAQDDHSLGVMLRFIVDRQPQGTQLILAIEKTMDVELGGQVLVLDEKYHLLKSAEYDGVRSEITALVKASIRS